MALLSVSSSVCTKTGRSSMDGRFLVLNSSSTQRLQFHSGQTSDDITDGPQQDRQLRPE